LICRFNEFISFFKKAHTLHPYPYWIPTPTLIVLGEALGGAHSQNYKGPTRGRAEAAPYSENALPQGFAFPCIK
jgi:hypothetical protein